MKQIGQGWQYRVHDVGAGRVFKIHRNNMDQFIRVFFSNDSRFRFRFWSSVRQVSRINHVSKKGVGELRKVLSRIPPYLLGNPSFKSDLNYEQDKVVPLESYFRTHTQQENIEAIRKYGLLLLELWRYGISDAVFNPDINSGVDREERVIQIDLGELTSQREWVEKFIREKKWLNQSGFKLMQEGLKGFYKNEMEKLISLENLNKNWNNAIKENSTIRSRRRHEAKKAG